jgi:septal ring factor EnvC (AmiA/AmiB activator)
LDSLSVTFAELLQGHLPRDSESDESTIPQRPKPSFSQDDGTATVPGMPALLLKADNPNLTGELEKLASQQVLDELSVEKAKVEGLERMLDQLRSQAAGQDALQAELVELQTHNGRLMTELAQAKHSLKGTQDERQTLEATCEDLHNELLDVRGMLEENESMVADHDSVLGDLQTAREREVAWRTRALKLERAAHAGDDFGGMLRANGLESTVD